MEKRFVICTERNYNLYFHEYESRKKPDAKGREYSIKGIFNLISGMNFEFVIDDKTAEDIMQEGENKRKKR